MGRPTLCTKELTERAAETIRRGGTWDDAAAACGVPNGTLRRWQADGRDEGADERYRAFHAAIEIARADLRINSLGTIIDAATSHDEIERRITTNLIIVRKKDGSAMLDETGAPLLVEERTETVVTRENRYDWRAALALLERKWPEDFALVNRLRDETPAENRPPVVAIEADAVRRALAQYDELDARRQAKANGQNGQSEAM